MGRETVQTEIFRPGDLPEELRGMMDAAPDHVCQTDGKIYFALDEIVVCCPDDLSGRGLIYALMRHRNPEMKHLGELEALCFRILTDPRYAACPERISDRRLIQDAHRCVAVFQSDLPLPQKLSFAFASMVPSEKGDITVSIDFRTVAFIRQFNHSSEGELAEFCNAVIDTLETEGIEFDM